MMDMQKQGRYCRYHEAPQRRPGRRGLGCVAEKPGGGVWPREREGRKRILPGQDNRNLGAGWYEAKRP